MFDGQGAEFESHPTAGAALLVLNAHDPGKHGPLGIALGEIDHLAVGRPRGRVIPILLSTTGDLLLPLAGIRDGPDLICVHALFGKDDLVSEGRPGWLASRIKVRRRVCQALHGLIHQIQHR